MRHFLEKKSNIFILESQAEKVNEILGNQDSLLKSILEMNQNAFAIFDEQGSFIYINEIGFDMLGIIPGTKEIPHKLFDFQGVDSFLKEELKQLKSIRFDNYIDFAAVQSIFPSTKYSAHHFNVAISPLYDNEGNFHAYMGTMTDITERNKEKFELKFKNERLEMVNKSLELLLQKSRISIWRLGFEDQEKKHGYGEWFMGYKESLLPKDRLSKAELMEYLGPDSKLAFFKDAEKVLNGDFGDSVIIDDFELLHPVTNEISVHRCSMHRTSGAEIIAMVTNITDIVEQKKEIEISEFKSKMIIEGGGLVPWEYNVEQDQYTYDKRLRLNHGTSDDIEEYRKQILPDFLEIFDDHCRMMNNGEDVTNSIEYAVQPLNSESSMYLNVFYTPYSYDENGRITRYVGYTRNITQRNHLIQELKIAKEKAEQADKLKSQFLANMSHEIRTPLNAIVGFSELLISAEDETEKAEWSEHISKNSDMLIHLINDILDLSKLESGSINIQNEEFNFSDTIADTGSMFSARINNPNVELVVSNPCTNLRIISDVNRLTQIINNFVSNAIKHTTHGTINLGYNLDGSNLKIYVKDTGKGISEEFQKRIFSRFEKYDDHTQGTGLGLAIVKAIAQQMNGDCGFESVLGEGSCFWVNVPVQVISSGEIASKGVATPEFSLNSLVDAKVKVLIAEDIDSNFLLAKSMLRNVNISRAVNGLEAVKIMGKEKFDIVLMDVQMPVMNGLDAIKEIRKSDTRTPIIVLTANAFENDKQNAIMSGANHFISKPVNRVDLVNSICEYVF